jgi:hypothetical protein
LLASCISYRGAIGFDQPLVWLVAPGGHGEYALLAVPPVDRVCR